MGAFGAAVRIARTQRAARVAWSVALCRPGSVTTIIPLGSDSSCAPKGWMAARSFAESDLRPCHVPSAIVDSSSGSEA